MARFYSIPFSQTHGGLYCGADGNLRLKAATQDEAAAELASWLREHPGATPGADLYRVLELEPVPAPAGLSFGERAERDYDRLATPLCGEVVGTVALTDETRESAARRWGSLGGPVFLGPPTAKAT